MTDRDRRRQVRAAARRPRVGHPQFDGWLRLESSGWYIQMSDVVSESAASTLVAEDTAWHFAVIDWDRRRPRFWRRAPRRVWRAEEQVLAAQASLLIRASTQLRTLRPMSDAAG